MLGEARAAGRALLLGKGLLEGTDSLADERGTLGELHALSLRDSSRLRCSKALELEASRVVRPGGRIA